MLKFIIFILLIFSSCESPKKIDKNLVESYKRYLFIQKVSNDSNITDQLAILYLDSLKINKLEFNSFLEQFNKDINFRKLVLREMTNKTDSVFYRKIYNEIGRLKTSK